MKVIILIFCLAAIHVEFAKSDLCLTKEECRSTNYQTYVECVRKRQKRSMNCDSSCESDNCINTCGNCDCGSCNYSNCQNSCNSCCNSCCSNYIPCQTNHCCHKTCHAQCSTSSCRSTCRRNCFNTVKEQTEEKIVVEQERAANTNITNLNRHNITTIIHLNNIINSTNVIDVPIVVNNTNTQNITLFNEQTGARSSGSLTEKCCTVISPRQCVTTPEPRCFHYRSKQCGPFCTADIVHKEHQQICQSNYPGAPPKCTQQILYIPQPQPKCSYQSVWPYVSCGIQKQETCQGCYSHYVDPQNVNYMSCPPQCYDDGFGMGNYYRQGPLYRPWYSHAPCYQCLGYQNPYNMAPLGYGGYLPPEFGGGAPYGGFPMVPQIQPYPYVPYYGPADNDTVSVLNMGMNQIADVSLIPGEDLQPPALLRDQRLPRELEIEVNYEPPSNAQAEVKIQKESEFDIFPTVEMDNNVDIIDNNNDSKKL